MELFIVCSSIIVINYFFNLYSEIEKKSTEVVNYQETILDEVYDRAEDEGKTVVNNYYVQNNVYIQNNHTKSRGEHKDHTEKVWRDLGYQIKDGETYAYKHYGREIYTPEQVENISTLTIKYSKYGLAEKLKEQTGSKRMAKNILVEQYGVGELEAKRLVGYRS